MEFHKPKPFHNWREFLKEYVIIVLGVLTALAAEQAAETLRHRADVADMTQKLREESRGNLEVLDYDMSSARGGLAALDRAIDTLSKNGAASAAPPLDAAPSILAPGDSAWAAIQYSALLPIMPKPLIANAWKIQFTNLALAARGSEFLSAYYQAQAATRIFAAAPTPAMRESLLLRLADASEVGHSYVRLVQALRIQIQWTLEGRQITMDTVRAFRPPAAPP